MTGEPDLRPLGVFAVASLGDHPEAARRAISSVAKLLNEPRRSVAAYLRSATMAMPFMEFTDDLVDGKFGVAGGSAIMTDGVYFWRLDTADYVETYGVGLPAEFIAHGRALGWTPLVLDRDRVQELEQELIDYYREGRDRDLLVEADW